MTYPRTIALTLSFLLLAACGGGGGGVPGEPGGGDPPPGGTDETTRSVLEACLLPGFNESLALLERYDDLLAGSGAAAGFSIVPGSIVSNEFTLEMLVSLDADGNQTEDGVGRLHFLSDANQPVNPFDAGQVALFTSSGVAALGTLLPTLPDGYGLSVEMSGLSAPAQGTVTWIYQSTLPSTSSGSLISIDEPCAVSLGWVDVSWAALLTPFPTAIFEVTVTQLEETLVGTLEADGTSSALVDVARNDGPVTQWTFDLLTGQAEPR